MEVARDSRVTTGISGFPLGWPWDAGRPHFPPASPQPPDESSGLPLQSNFHTATTNSFKNSIYVGSQGPQVEVRALNTIYKVSQTSVRGETLRLHEPLKS